jgi:hypothetical protein
MSNPPTVVAIVSAYNEEDIIEQVVRALIDDGVLVYFLDDRSSDKTVAQVEPFQGRGVIGIETPPADRAEDENGRGFIWERILRRKEELAQTLNADWFIHHDADEFRESPWAGQTLREGIQRVDAAGYNAIDFQVLNFSPTMADPADGGDIRDRLLFYEPGRSFDRLQIKCWKKTGEPVVLTESGGHEAQFSDRHIFPVRFLLRHYPIRSQSHGERKVFRERLPRFASSERARGWHVQYNEFVEGVSFLREPASLRRYDAEAVRLDLFLRHRDVERLERVVAAGQELADRLTAEGMALSRRLQAQDAEMDSLRVERERLLSDVEALRGKLTATETAIAELLASRDELLASRDGLLALRDDLLATRAALLASRSWKLTAPLRAADRLFRRRSPESSRQDHEAQKP